MKKTSICPKCRKTYHGHPALSREDGFTEICSDCGMMEAMTDAGMSLDEQKDLREIMDMVYEQLHSEGDNN